MATRYLVGIDLGTTNSALAYIDLAEQPRQLRDFPMPQLVGPGDVAARPTLASLHHHTSEHELPRGATRLPWTPAGELPSYVIGELARIQAQAVPGRSIASAKSWLCHPRVDRLADILPWGGSPDVPRLSPVEASARYLRHMLSAFCSGMKATLAEIEIVLTVPASFDEVARELTVEAARRAGIDLGQLTLVEEPQAAFYHWLEGHARRSEEVEAGDVIFVCDIGGGTTDFTLIDVQKSATSDKAGKGLAKPASQAKKISFSRTAVGDHLLLGGDNMDLALARRVEQQLVGPSGARLPTHTFAGLVQACRQGKERLLDEQPPETWTVHVAGRGSKLIGGGLHAELVRAEVEKVLLDGFFPIVAPDAEPARSRAGLQEFGLPYAADAAVTRYVAAFLRQHKATPTAILFNGGVLRAPAIRQRLLDALAALIGQRPRLLTNDAPDLAVARGAAYYALARRGEGLRISGGAARAYYVEVEAAAQTRAQDAPRSRDQSLVCLTPRGLEEGAEVDLAGRPLELLTNRPVRFRLFSSAQREGDKPGDVLRVPASELPEFSELPPLYTVLRYPRSSQERPIAVHLGARLTEIGTLELWAISQERSEAGQPLRWKLQFDLRSSEGPVEKADKAEPAAAGDRALSSPELGRARRDAPSMVGFEPGERADIEAPAAEAGLIQAAAEQIAAVFTGTSPAAGLPKALSTLLGPKDGWSTATLRALWEVLKKHREARARSAAHEARWLNLAGFCLRPGFGYALDDWRVKEAWRVFNAGLSHEKDDACKLEWWILWRRIAGGLSRTQQDELWKRASPLLLPQLRRVDKKPPGPQEAAEIWRALAACERLEVKKKVELGDVLMGQIEKRRSEHALWAIGRLGARAPLYGSIDNVVSPALAERWLNRLMATLVGPETPVEERYQLGQAAAELGRLTGDRVRDLPEATRRKLAAWLGEVVTKRGSDGVPESEHLSRVVREVVPREEREERFAFGDTLPVGLRLLPQPEPGSLPSGTT